jgi:hypothetical protein
VILILSTKGRVENSKKTINPKCEITPKGINKFHRDIFFFAVLVWNLIDMNMSLNPNYDSFKEPSKSDRPKPSYADLSLSAKVQPETTLVFLSPESVKRETSKV